MKAVDIARGCSPLVAAALLGWSSAAPEAGIQWGMLLSSICTLYLTYRFDWRTLPGSCGRFPCPLSH
jgi:hypothetical protein